MCRGEPVLLRPRGHLSVDRPTHGQLHVWGQGHGFESHCSSTAPTNTSRISPKYPESVSKWAAIEDQQRYSPKTDATMAEAGGGLAERHQAMAENIIVHRHRKDETDVPNTRITSTITPSKVESNLNFG
ncbi:hypothetical protein SKAU_G00149380 [Synaphobranchus kaupii]|uniref:Uncharacterized protein n=1 Tax=Synaphobranchus kaupii TaxID=118154 RepID=A0A9Q1J2W2_SYNKA|nr:hypothetical protein SKAU_G00149380 [Synaphobranchus kaupii]